MGGVAPGGDFVGIRGFRNMMDKTWKTGRMYLIQFNKIYVNCYYIHQCQADY